MIKFKSNEIDKKQVNEILGLSKNILKILYILIIIALIFVSTIVFKEWKIWEFIKTILRVLAPLFLGIVIAWLLNPFVKWLEKKKIRRSIGSFFAYFILIGVIVLIIKSIIPLLYNQTIELVDNFPKIFSNVKEWVVDILGKFESKTINIDNIENMKIVPYIYDMEKVMNIADLIVARSGAMTITEISNLGKASILVPLPNVSNNHQMYNAKVLEKINAAEIIENDNMNGKLLNKTINEIVSDQEKLKLMGASAYSISIKDTQDKIFQEILALINRKSLK